jgi:hypothetical protein
MAQQFNTQSGQTLTVPGSYAELNVQNNPTNNAISGVLILVGEADAGPRFDAEPKLRLNAFGPQQKSELVAKYKSGPLVDAFIGATAASNDSQITGSFTSCIIVKTNQSVKASSILSKVGGGDYGTLSDAQGGQLGNLFYSAVTNTPEVAPTTGPIVWTVPQVNTNASIRVNGGANHTLALTSSSNPAAIVSAINGLTAGVTATGGVSRGIISATTISDGGQLAVGSLSGKACVLTLSEATAWAALPVVGDIFVIPTTSVISAAANRGTYVVCSVTSNTIGLYKLADATGGSVTNPAAQSATTITASDATEVRAYSPITVSVNTTAASGQGQSLEIADTSTGTFSNTVFTFAGATASPPAALADWTSTTASPWAIPSTTEYGVTLAISRQLDAINQKVTVNGKVILTLGVVADTASAVISGTTLTLTVVGGPITSQTINLSQFPTINDLVVNLTALGLKASAATSTIGQSSPLNLDQGTYYFASSKGALTGRIKADGAAFQSAVNATGIVSFTAAYPATIPTGLPQTQAQAAFSGGSRGGTTNTDVSQACDAMQKVRGNFVIPLFSCDATVDVADGLTATTSTYDLASVAALIKAHVLFMSQLKQRRPRLGLMSYRGAYADAKEFAGNMAQARCVTFFQDIRDVNSVGNTVQYRPWMAACKAGGMQAAGVYKPIVNKYVNIQGALQAAGDFDDDLTDSLADALQAGLCPITVDENGAWLWASDQTTYGADNNWIFNSLQAMYVGDLIQTTTMIRTNRAFVGQSVADISASIAAMVVGRILDNFKEQKWLAASDDAPGGWKNLIIKLQGPALVVSVEIKVAGATYFVPINFQITPVVQSAG